MSCIIYVACHIFIDCYLW